MDPIRISPPFELAPQTWNYFVVLRILGYKKIVDAKEKHLVPPLGFYKVAFALVCDIDYANHAFGQMVESKRRLCGVGSVPSGTCVLELEDTNRDNIFEWADTPLDSMQIPSG